MSKAGAVFGRDLVDVVQGNGLPALVEDCVNWIENQALDEEGLFRIPGDTKSIKKLRDMYESVGTKGHIDLSAEKGLTAHTVAGLLKAFMRELPDPLFMFRFYESFVQVVKNPDAESRIRSLRNVVKNLPPTNRTVLIYLLRFLNKFSQHANTNKMSLINIAVCWAPNLLRSKEESYEKIMREAALVNEVFILLIENIEFISLDKPDPNLTQSTPKQPNHAPTLMQSTPNGSSSNLMQSLPSSPPLSPTQTRQSQNLMSSQPPTSPNTQKLMSSQPPTSPNVQKLQGSDWREATTKEGRKYYYNVVTRQTSWTIPDGVAKQPENKQEPKVEGTQQTQEHETKTNEKPNESPNSPKTSETKPETNTETPTHSETKSETTPETKPDAESPKEEPKEDPKENPSAPKTDPRNNRPVKQVGGYLNPATTNTLSIPQMKQMLDELGISYSAQLSRNDLVKLVMDNFTVNIPPPISVAPRKSQI